jgi:hypothetical protein
MVPFDCFAGIDWSGDKKKWQKGLKIACAEPGSAPPKLVDGPGYKYRWSRTEAVRWIQELIGEKRALIGLDFAFGFPQNEISLNWEYVERLCGESPNFYGGEFFRISNGAHSHLVNSPWWRRDSRFIGHLRATERAAKLTTGAAPQSVFNAVGKAQVGPSSISGMRALLYLQRASGHQISIWPFNEIDNNRSVMVEIFPRYFPCSKSMSPKLYDHASLNSALSAFGSEPVTKAPTSEDEGDALLSAAALRFLSTEAALFQSYDQVIQQEGWIFGVPFGVKP